MNSCSKGASLIHIPYTYPMHFHSYLHLQNEKRTLYDADEDPLLYDNLIWSSGEPDVL